MKNFKDKKLKFTEAEGLSKDSNIISELEIYNDEKCGDLFVRLSYPTGIHYLAAMEHAKRIFRKDTGTKNIKDLEIKLKVDDSEIDEAYNRLEETIQKAKELKRILESLNNLE